MNKKRISYILLVIFILAYILTGCQSSVIENHVYQGPTSKDSLPTQIVQSNSDYTLKWDDEKKCVLFEDLVSGKIWSNIPYEYYKEEGSSVNLNSTLNITVADNTSLQWTSLRGYTETVRNGSVVCEEIDDGLKVTYSFDKYQVLIPVTYVLRDESLVVTIDSKNIREGSDYSLVSVSLAPFLCSSRNQDSDAYLFVPSGMGGLMYAKETAELERTFSCEVFGEDPTRPLPENVANNKMCHLPVFGVKDASNALFGIIEEGAESAVIEAQAGNGRTGYSSIYPTFYFRGYDVYDKDTFAELNDDLIRVSTLMSTQPVSVAYYPLSGENADYNGMAKCYRRYLQERGDMVKSTVTASQYGVTILGGVMTTSSVLGIPKKTLGAMTTLSQSQRIIDELITLTGEAPSVRLMGFGNGGISPDKVGGEFKLDPILGKQQQRDDLELFCKENGVSLFTDFDLIKYNKSGNGYSYSKDSARTAVSKIAEKYPITTALRQYDESLPYRLLRRDKLTTTIDKLIKVTQKSNISGISLSSLGNLAYSDYSNNSYAVKGYIQQDVRNMLSKTRAEGHPVSTGANSYAVMESDLVFDAPLGNGGYNALDEEIPFYQMVFRDLRPMYSEAINLSANASQQIMVAASGGMGIGFTIINDYDIKFMENEEVKLYGAVYEDNKNLIIESVNKYSDYFNAVLGSGIERYDILHNGVSKTVFDNGVVLYCNHTTTTTESPLGELAAYGYKWAK